MAQGRPHEAIDAFTAALAVVPDDVEYFVLRASALIKADRRAEAKSDLETALRFLNEANGPPAEVESVRMRLGSL
jgi:Flp pilus assembly protein TadD